MSAVPTKPGFYWAKWILTDDEVPEGYTAFKTWEPVEVYVRDNDDGPDELRVWMIGHVFSQALDCFHWGEPLAEPVDKLQAIKDQTAKEERDRIMRRYRSMTTAERIADWEERRKK